MVRGGGRCERQSKQYEQVRGPGQRHRCLLADHFIRHSSRCPLLSSRHSDPVPCVTKCASAHCPVVATGASMTTVRSSPVCPAAACRFPPRPETTRRNWFAKDPCCRSMMRRMPAWRGTLSPVFLELHPPPLEIHASVSEGFKEAGGA